jgi:hypothetical protein
MAKMPPPTIPPTPMESVENVPIFSSVKMLSSRPSRILPETTIRHLRRSEGDFQHFEFGALVL